MEYVTQMAVARPGPVGMPVSTPTLHSSLAHPWYALCIRQRQREQCEEYLAALSYEFFSPTRSEVHQWTDRKKAIQVPLFPGYMFCRFDPHQSSPILRAPGVTGVINSGGHLLEVDATQIEDVHKSLQTGFAIDVVHGLVCGQRVKIASGVMAGVEGVLVMVKNQLRVGLEITMMNRSVLVEVNSSQLLPL